MKKLSVIYLLAIIVVLTLVYSFKPNFKTISKTTSSKQEEATASYTIPISPIPSTVVLTKSNSGIYVNDFDLILGNSAAELTLLNWCNTNGFRTLNLSGINSSINSSNSAIRTATCTALNNFIGIAKAAPYYKTINIIVGGANSALGVYNNYYNNISYPNKFNGYLTEYEFWNTNSYSGVSATCPTYAEFANLTATLAAISSWAPAIAKYAYIGNSFTDAACFTPITNTNCLTNSLSCVSNSTTIFTNIINNYNRLYLAYYQSASCCTITSTMLGRLNTIANAAAAQSKTVSIEIIYTSKYDTDPTSYDLYNYFASPTTQNPLSSYVTTPINQTFSSAYSNFVTQYSALTTAQLPNKANLRLMGHTIFRYTEAKQARP